MSFIVDNEAKASAESYDAEVLLDKMNLYLEMIPAILGLAKPGRQVARVHAVVASV